MTLRALSTQTEFEQAVSLQEQIWGADVGEAVPTCVLQVSQEIGGIAVGAFTPDDLLVGLVFGLTGFRNGEPAHWSHILAVDGSWRDRGIGRLLKDHQRAVLLNLDVHKMYWTYDPLESRNAHLNLNVLGASVESYVPHYYGERAVALTDQGIGTDRFIVRWDLSLRPLPPVTANLNLVDIPLVAEYGVPVAEMAGAVAVPGSPDIVRIEAPADVQTLKQHDPNRARFWREATREAFTGYLDAGFEVTEFRVDSEAGGGWYILMGEPQR